MPESPEQIDRALSSELRARAEALGVYKNKTGKGDGREELMLDQMRLRVGTAFGIVKAEIADSNGRGTLEHDAVIYDQGSASCLFAVGHRRVVRVESVAITVEVKSDLGLDAISQVVDASETGLATLTRFYKAELALDFVGKISQLNMMKASGASTQFDGTREMLTNGLNALSGHVAIPPVLSMIFGYDGPMMDTAKSYMKTRYVDAICVLEKYTLAKRTLGKEANPEDIELWGEGADAFGAFLCLIEGMLDHFRSSRNWVRPDFFRYYTQRSS